MRKASSAYSSSENVELLLSKLEKLKAEISAIETQYDMLKAGYAKICDDAILRVAATKARADTEEFEVYDPAIGNLEARFMLGLVEAGTYSIPENDSESNLAPETEKFQRIIDKAASGIEFGLDKLGDGMVYPIEKIYNACTLLSSGISRQMKRQR